MAATYVLISSQVLASSSFSVTFSSISQSYTDLKLVMSTRSNTSGNNDGYVDITFNGDSSSNYSNIQLYGRGTTGSGSLNHYNATYSDLGNGGMDSAGNTANTFSSLELYLPNYTTTTTKQFFAFGAAEDNSTGNSWITNIASLYRGTAAITSITISELGATTMAAGSSFYLYGIKNA